MPALPLDAAGKYVAGAYLVFLTLILVYVAIIGAKISRIERDVSELLELEERDGEEDGRSPSVHDGRDARRSHQNAGLEAPRS
jgi:hypothetical protein